MIIYILKITMYLIHQQWKKQYMFFSTNVFYTVVHLIHWKYGSNWNKFPKLLYPKTLWGTSLSVHHTISRHLYRKELMFMYVTKCDGNQCFSVLSFYETNIHKIYICICIYIYANNTIRLCHNHTPTPPQKKMHIVNNKVCVIILC